jgi:hypothetical protein
MSGYGLIFTLAEASIVAAGVYSVVGAAKLIHRNQHDRPEQKRKRGGNRKKVKASRPEQVRPHA